MANTYEHPLAPLLDSIKIMMKFYNKSVPFAASIHLSDNNCATYNRCTFVEVAQEIVAKLQARTLAICISRPFSVNFNRCQFAIISLNSSF